MLKYVLLMCVVFTIACAAVTTTERPHSHCATACFLIYKPVCATDGNTYSNECVMHAESCKKGLTLKVAHHGTC